MEALKIEHLFKNYGGLQVLQNVSFSIEVGENLAIIGPNGAGKTTLFNLLTGDLSPTAGRVYILGQDVTNMPTHRRIHLGLARSYQITTLFLTLTVLDTVLLAIHGTKPSRLHYFRPTRSYQEILDSAQTLLETFDLWERRDELVQYLSYGELRKMEIALALASKPKLLLMDEPSAGLAKAETEAFIGMIRELSKDTTLFFAAHDMDMVFGLADRIMVLYFGQIIAQGSPDDIQADPKVREIYLGLEKGTTDAGAS